MIASEELLAVIKIDYDIALCSQNKLEYKHWATQSRIKKESAEAALRGYQQLKRKIVLTSEEHYPVILDVVVCRKTRMDTHNIRGALKWMVDALFARRPIEVGGKILRYDRGIITPDDSDKYIVQRYIKQLNDPIYKNKEFLQFYVYSTREYTSDEKERLRGN